MDKEDILQEIKRVAKASGGKAPGMQLFEKKTGIKRRDWYPTHWLRWSDALVEAGLEPNRLTKAYRENDLLRKFSEFIRELDHFPVSGEIELKCSQDVSFPGHGVMQFKRFGGKAELAKKIIRFCGADGADSEWQDVVEICEDIANSGELSPRNAIVLNVPKPTGSVYMIKAGNDYKIGKTFNIGRRRSELSIQLPKKHNLICELKTPFPAAVEAYWHNRFSSKRGNGEWFKLSAEDIKAFKRMDLK
jgi:hypothetical protein